MPLAKVDHVAKAGVKAGCEHKEAENTRRVRTLAKPTNSIYFTNIILSQYYIRN